MTTSHSVTGSLDSFNTTQQLVLSSIEQHLANRMKIQELFRSAIHVILQSDLQAKIKSRAAKLNKRGFTLPTLVIFTLAVANILKTKHIYSKKLAIKLVQKTLKFFPDISEAAKTSGKSALEQAEVIAYIGKVAHILGKTSLDWAVNCEKDVKIEVDMIKATLNHCFPKLDQTYFLIEE